MNSRAKPNLRSAPRDLGQIARLLAIFQMTGLGDAALSRQLGYSNQTTLHKLRRGRTFVSTGCLVEVAKLELAKGIFPNLHWVLTGQGPAVTHTREAGRWTGVAADWAKTCLDELLYEVDGTGVDERRAARELHSDLNRRIEELREAFGLPTVKTNTLDRMSLERVLTGAYRARRPSS